MNINTWSNHNKETEDTLEIIHDLNIDNQSIQNFLHDWQAYLWDGNNLKLKELKNALLEERKYSTFELEQLSEAIFNGFRTNNRIREHIKGWIQELAEVIWRDSLGKIIIQLKTNRETKLKLNLRNLINIYTQNNNTETIKILTTMLGKIENEREWIEKKWLTEKKIINYEKFADEINNLDGNYRFLSNNIRQELQEVKKNNFKKIIDKILLNSKYKTYNDTYLNSDYLLRFEQWEKIINDLKEQWYTNLVTYLKVKIEEQEEASTELNKIIVNTLTELTNNINIVREEYKKEKTQIENSTTNWNQFFRKIFWEQDISNLESEYKKALQIKHKNQLNNKWEELYNLLIDYLRTYRIIKTQHIKNKFTETYLNVLEEKTSLDIYKNQ